MAGSDQSVNLGGMLSQIAQTTGQMGGAYQPVMQAATKPRGDMNDPQHLMRMAEWARQNGDAQAASMYMQQSRVAQAELDKKRQAALQQAKVGMVNEYAKLSRDPNASPEAKQKAYEDLVGFSNNSGVDVQREIAGIDQQANAAEEKAFRDGQRKEAEAEKNAITAINTAVQQAGADTEALLKVVEKAPAQFRGQAETIVNRTITFNERQAKAKQDAKDLSSPVSAEPARASIADISNEEVRARYESQLEELEKTAPKEGQQWANAAERHQYNQKMDRLAREALNIETQAILADDAVSRQKEKEYERAKAKAYSAPVKEADIEAYKNAVDLEGWDWWQERGSLDKAIRDWRVSQVEAAYGKAPVSEEDLVNKYL